MRSRLSTFARALTLHLALATLVLWVATNFVSPARIVLTVSTDAIGQVCDTDKTVIAIHGGVFYFGRYQWGPAYRANLPTLTYKTTREIGILPPNFSFEDTLLGFSAGGWGVSSAMSYDGWQYSFPLWFVALLLFGLWRYTRPPRNPDLLLQVFLQPYGQYQWRMPRMRLTRPYVHAELKRLLHSAGITSIS